MRKVVLRWRINSLQGAKELGKILEICDKIEILAHLGFQDDGIIQLAEVKLKEGKDLNELSDLPSFEVLEVHEENKEGILLSLLCHHALVKSAIEVSNLHLQCPYGIDAERGMELRVTGLTAAMRRFLNLLRLVLPPDKVSVITDRKRQVNGWAEVLTERQQEVIRHAVLRGYYENNGNPKIKDLAEELGISRSTYGGHLSEAEKAILKKVGSDLE